MRKISWLRALARYYRDPERSWVGKAVALAALVYAASPVDLIPDVPIVGWLDDLGVMGLASLWLGTVVRDYRHEHGGRVRLAQREEIPTLEQRLTRSPQE